MLTEAQAKEICDSLGLTENESLFLRCVARHETSYGSGWKSGQGLGSWNMGAVTTTSPDVYSFQHVDSRFDPRFGKVVTYTTWFAGYPSAKAGFLGLARVLLKDNVREALAKGDFLGAVSAMYDNHYFLGLHTHENVEGDRDNIEEYYKSVAANCDAIGRGTGEKQPEVLAA